MTSLPAILLRFVGAIVPFLALVLEAGEGRPAARAVSPDGQLVLVFNLDDQGTPTYRLDYQGQPLVLASPLGFEPDPPGGYRLVDVESRREDADWEHPAGERRHIPNRCAVLSIELRGRDAAALRVLFRVYNEGVALRLVPTGRPEDLRAARSGRVEFRFPADTHAWREDARGGHHRGRMTEVSFQERKPLALEFGPRRFGVLTESGGDAPWHVLIVGRSPGDLIERNYLPLNLAPPVAFADTSWLRFGTVFRSAARTTESGKSAIRVASGMGFQNVQLGPQPLPAGDGNEAAGLPVHPALDLCAVVQYAQDRDMGIFVPVAADQLRVEPERVLAWYARQGVRGLVVDGAGREGGEVSWLGEVSALAARHRLVLELRGVPPVAGLSRTYPNLVFTGGHGAAASPASAAQACVLAFTGDGRSRVDAIFADAPDAAGRTTHAHQLALAVVVFNPLLAVAGGGEGGGRPRQNEWEFLRRLPAVWDETRVLEGEISRSVAVARRRGEDWFVGAINGDETRRMTLALEFLDPGRAYVAYSYSDPEGASEREPIVRSVRKVFSRDRLELELRVAGGAAVWLTPDVKQR